ncbi:MAG: glycosyltransferase [Armatimonadetes bacterium]|nr:glycosyltransferase [Armatimonadota bacterium]MDE2206249.1 glycosyltransferase [Armatimonadota bacterium]
MNVALFSECYLPITNGVVTSMCTLRQALEEQGHHVAIFAPGDPLPDDGPDVYRLPALPFPRHPYHWARPFPRVPLNIDELRLEVVHCQHPFTIGRLGAVFAARHALPMVYTAHTLYDTMAGQLRVPLARNLTEHAVRSLVRSFCQRAEIVVAPSAVTVRQLRRNGVRSRMELVPSSVIPPRCTVGGRARLRSSLGIDEHDRVILTLGRLGVEKRVDIVLEAMALLLRRRDLRSTTHLLVVGGGPCADDLRTQAADLGLGRHVHFAGSQPHNRIGDWYAAADLFTLASPVETQGLVVLEAMCCGLPVVLVDEGGAREFVRDGVDGLRVPLDAVALSEGWGYVLSDQDLRLRLAQEAQRRSGDFTPAAMAGRMLEVYRAAIESRRIRTPRQRRPMRSRWRPRR